MNHLTGKALRACVAAVCGALVIAAVWIALRWNAPPLKIIRNGPKVTVNVSTLGEYPTTITRIRLSDVRTKAVLWEISADNGEAQIRGFTLIAGENTVHVDADYGSYRVVEPSQSGLFTLNQGIEYRLQLWGAKGVLTERSAVFHLADSR